MKTPLFSICHTSARPDRWRAVYDDWMRNAVDPASVEYVLCIDPRWGFSLDPAEYVSELDNIHVVQNTGRRCYVDGVNIAAKAATGAILIVNADDQFACEAWDVALLVALAAGRSDLPESAFDTAASVSFVLEPSTGTPNEHERGILVMPILSRKRYEDQGGEVFFHEYESMCADNDFCEHARLDNVVVDTRHLMFPHRHPMFDKHGWKSGNWKQMLDAQYLAQNSGEASDTGRRTLAWRRASGFASRRPSRRIAVCVPGDDFKGAMLDSLWSLQGHLLLNGWDPMKVRGYTSNVYVTREDMRRPLMELKPDLILWLDHDNPITPEQFDRLVCILDSRPDLDGISGWCWIHDEGKQRFTPSCGLWAPDHLHWQPFPPSFARETELRSFECGGFPCFLMKFSALEKAGDSPFLPVVDNRLEHGLLGEDFAFFLAAERGGAHFAVDPTVRVPHLKYVEVNPVFESEGAPTPVKVACMLRAKNEGRWIGRTIDSARDLCGENIFVMVDESTDNTVEVCEAHGAVVLPSPFIGMGLDERRDKNWLLEEVNARCTPDWILMPDGDEELEPGGCAKIRLALESNPACDCFALRFLNLWNSVDTVRLDGVYGTMLRQSLFRANMGLQFKSYYEGEGENHNHVGLHTSNAPGLGGLKVRPLNVYLLHYGYLHKEDRIRKYRWITDLDPHNEAEGFYLHTVQGDVLEVPADAKLKHAGPLELRKLPARLVPQFQTVPGPLVPALEAEGVQS